MKKTLIVACSLVTTVDGDRVTIEPGTSILLPDKTYGLKDADIDRIINAGGGKVIFSDVEIIDEAKGETITLSDERLNQLVKAIFSLDDNEESHWTGNGSPEVAVLKEITGGKVSAAERDAAWLVFQSQ